MSPSDVPYDDPYQYDNFYGSSMADGKTIEQTIEETTPPQIPKGIGLFVVSHIVLATVSAQTGEPEEKAFDAYMPDDNGENTIKVVYFSHIAEVHFAYTASPNPDRPQTTRMQFRLPPTSGDSEEIRYYMQGSTKERGNSINGFFYNQLKRFLHSLGIPCENDGSFSDANMRFGTWRLWPDNEPRYVYINMQQQRPIPGKEQQLDAAGRPYMQPLPFGFKESEDTLARLPGGKPLTDNGATLGHPAIKPAQPQQQPQRPVQQPVRQPVQQPAQQQPVQRPTQQPIQRPTPAPAAPKKYGF